MIWAIKTSPNGTYQTMRSPSAMSIDGEDLDLDSYRSVATGNIIRQILGFKWQKLGFTFVMRSEEDVAAFLEPLRDTNPLYVKVQSPIMSVNGFVELVGYVSKIHIDARRNRDGSGLAWTVSFDFTEGER